MIEVIFTLDYEIYGNGSGDLYTLVYQPARQLKQIFDKWGLKFVIFAEAAELEVIEREGTDPAIGSILEQLRDFYENNFEIGLHIHPQWYNANYQGTKWTLHYAEYNLCVLKKSRIEEIIARSIYFFREVLGSQYFTPLSFRAGNWLLQPTSTVASILYENGVRVDSSVFKGGVQHLHGLDYRPSLKNGYYWKFSNDVNVTDPHGFLLELPIFTQMVPFWKMITAKRMVLEAKRTPKGKKRSKNIKRLIDFCRFSYPLKLDFCRMTFHELRKMFEHIITEDKKTPGAYKPIVAIGHTKDLVDLKSIESLLRYLKEKEIPVLTFTDVYPKCI